MKTVRDTLKYTRTAEVWCRGASQRVCVCVCVCVCVFSGAQWDTLKYTRTAEVWCREASQRQVCVCVCVLRGTVTLPRPELKRGEKTS